MKVFKPFCFPVKDFLDQNIEQNAPEKKIPSTHANAISLVEKFDSLSFIHFKAHSPFFLIQS